MSIYDTSLERCRGLPGEPGEVYTPKSCRHWAPCPCDDSTPIECPGCDDCEEEER